MRLDKWLWAARFFKTRSLAADEIGKGRVQVNAQAVKPARLVRLGDLIAIRHEGAWRSVVVQGLSSQRGPAPQAALLYVETAESIASREQVRQQRSLAPEPALAMTQGRPTKRDRRDLADWDRWSASIDPS